MEGGIDHNGVMKILEGSGVGIPSYLKWGRTHSGCYFRFFQSKTEWLRLLQMHPEDFEEAQAYEKISEESGKNFTWIQGMPLAELRKPENIELIKQSHQERMEQYRKKCGNEKLVEVLEGLEDEEIIPKACLICQL